MTLQIDRHTDIALVTLDEERLLIIWSVRV